MQLDDDVVAAEQVDQPVEFARGGVVALGGQGLADAALAASGEHEPVPGGTLGQVVEVVHRAALLAAGELRRR